MTHLHRSSVTILLTCLSLLCGCASLHRDPLKVTVAGIQPVRHEGLGLRMMVNLRVQNPNDAPVNYDGMAVEMSVQGKPIASGVSDEAGSVPRFGETVVGVPLTISAMHLIKEAVGLIGSGKIHYKMTGKLNVQGGGTTRFDFKGELALPD